MGGRADFLLDREMVVQRHLLKSGHHTLIGVHCKNITGKVPVGMIPQVSVSVAGGGRDLPTKSKAISAVDLAGVGDGG